MPEGVVVIGAGVIGLCSAYYARARGMEVTVIDRGPLEPSGCSLGNAGMIVPSHFVPLAAPGMVSLGLRWMLNPKSPLYIKPRLSWSLLDWGWRFARACTRRHVASSAPLLAQLGLASRALYDELSLKLGDFSLTRRGLLMLCKRERTLEAEGHLVELGRELGVEARVLDARQTAELDAGVEMDVAGSVYFPGDCHFTPQAFMAGLRGELERAGVRFIWRAPVTGWRRASRRLRAAITGAGEFEAGAFVLAGGVWSPDALRELGLRLPMQAGKGYSLTLDRPVQLPRLCSICTEARVAVTPMSGTLRFAGTMEIAGVDESINPRRVQGIVEAVPRYFPRFKGSDFAGVEPWAGLRPCSPDGLPYLGKPRATDNLVVAAGHGMMGMSLGPITGQLVALLLAEESPDFDLSLLSPDRHG